MKNDTKETLGRPRHTASAYQLSEAHELTLLDRFLAIQAFNRVVFKNYTREEAVATVLGYTLTGSLKKAGQISGINYNLVKQWSKTDWWNECVLLAREIISEKLEDKLTSILNEALNQLAQRLDTGNIIFRNGKTAKVPIGVAELTKIVQILFDKRQLIRGDVTSRSENKSMDTRLDEIKKRAEEFVRDQEVVNNDEKVVQLKKN